MGLALAQYPTRRSFVAVYVSMGSGQRGSQQATGDSRNNDPDLQG